MAILAQYKYTYQGETLKYFANDNLGSTRVAYSSAGVVEDKLNYSAYGELSVEVGSIDSAFFTGKQYDPTGLYYFNARYYDPKTGRFLQEDPASQGNSWYTYCSNNPINFVDDDGKQGNAPWFVGLNGETIYAKEMVMSRADKGYYEYLADAVGKSGAKLQMYLDRCNAAIGIGGGVAALGGVYTVFDQLTTTQLGLLRSYSQATNRGLPKILLDPVNKTVAKATISGKKPLYLKTTIDKDGRIVVRGIPSETYPLADTWSIDAEMVGKNMVKIGTAVCRNDASAPPGATGAPKNTGSAMMAELWRQTGINVPGASAYSGLIIELYTGRDLSSSSASIKDTVLGKVRTNAANALGLNVTNKASYNRNNRGWSILTTVTGYQE